MRINHSPPLYPRPHHAQYVLTQSRTPPYVEMPTSRPRRAKRCPPLRLRLLRGTPAAHPPSLCARGSRDTQASIMVPSNPEMLVRNLCRTANVSNQPLSKRLSRLNPSVLRGIPHGLEKENLRTRPYGILAHSPYPAAQGSPRTPRASPQIYSWCPLNETDNTNTLLQRG